MPNSHKFLGIDNLIASWFGVGRYDDVVSTRQEASDTVKWWLFGTVAAGGGAEVSYALLTGNTSQVIGLVIAAVRTCKEIFVRY